MRAQAGQRRQDILDVADLADFADIDLDVEGFLQSGDDIDDIEGIQL